ncbi:trypsin-like serine protease [Streptomyces sp. NBC_01092]|uniref:trypsin-like serine protease n=1 Tax=Streptomyces sp. NBC_01092 TaxID=2903748 RepID=UPI00386C0711|nr:trypsin-like serine protease [Streptomyces sp. NBC_01092]
MARHRRTTAKGRHRKPSQNARPGLITAAAGGLLYATLSVSGASAAELTDEQPISADESGGYVEESYGGDSHGQESDGYAEDSYGGGSYGQEPGGYTEEPGADAEAQYDEPQPEAEAEPLNAEAEPDGYTEQPGADAEAQYDEPQPEAEAQPLNAEAEPGTEGTEPGVRLVNEVDGVPVFQVLDDNEPQPESDAGDGQPPTEGQLVDGGQPPADEEPQLSDGSEEATVSPGDRIQPEGIPLGSSGCTAGPIVSDGSGASGILTAEHCGGTRWTDRDARYVGSVQPPEVEVDGNDTEIIRLDGDVVPETDFTGIAEPEVGQDVCARGATSAEMGRGLERCGQVTDLDVTVHYDKQEKDADGQPILMNGLPVYQIGPTVTDLIETDIPTLAGDSGGPLYTKDGREVVGTLSGGNGDFPDTCGSPNAVAGPCFAPNSKFVPIAKGLSSFPGWGVSVAPGVTPSESADRF